MFLDNGISDVISKMRIGLQYIKLKFWNNILYIITNEIIVVQ